MANFYPHKQTFVIFVICVLVVIGSYLYINNDYNKVTTKSVASGVDVVDPGLTEQEEQQYEEQFANWQKQFLSEGSIFASTSKQVTKNTSSSQPLTTTDKLGRDLFIRYIELNQNNLAEDDRFVENAAEQTLDETVSAISGPKIYSIGDITVSSGVSEQDLRSYGNAVAMILISYSPKSNAVEITSNAFATKNFGLLAEIDPITLSYNKMITSLRNVPAPQVVSKHHLDLINGFSMIAYLTEGLRNITKEPLPAIVAISSHKDAEGLSLNAMMGIKNYFSNNNIYFADNEAGQLFSTANLTLQ